MEIYTPIEQAATIIRERWANVSLRKRVEEMLNGDIPDILKNGPNGLIWRCICTPDDEFRRFLDWCEKARIEPVAFENSEDKFYAGNFTKHGLTHMRFKEGININRVHYIRKKRIIDFKNAEKKRMCDLQTIWGESLVDFHHSFMQMVFPIMKGRIVDISDWIQRKGGTPRKYYFSVLSLSICHAVYFDDYDLLESERGFTDEIILPIFDEVKKYFGEEPIIVKISHVGEHDRDPHWWCYSKDAKMLMDHHLSTLS